MPWLVGILVNRARERHRQQSRTIDPDRIVAPGAPDPAREASEREFQLGLEKVLRQVHEPFRSVVTQHLLRGMTTKDIAFELGIPAATVRTRLHRGIQQLRTRLPNGAVALALAPTQIPAQSLAAVRQVVTGHARLKRAAAMQSSLIPATVIGGLAMKKLLAVAALLLLGLATWQLLDVSTIESSAEQPAPPPSQSASIAAQDKSVRTTSEDSIAAPRVQAADRVAVGVSGHLVVLVRNEKTLRPLPNIKVTASHPPARSQPQSTLTATASSSSADDPAPNMAQGTTDESGRVTLHIAAGHVRVGANHGLPQVTFVDVQPDEVIEHVHDIPASLAADVLVLDERGEPIPFATILGPGESAFEPREIGKADAHGRWQEDRTDVELMVRAATAELAASTAQRIRSDKPSVVITLSQKSATIHGMVLDETGTAIPGAMILFASTNPQAARDLNLSIKCDEQGRYQCSWLHEGLYRILATQLIDRKVQRSAVFRATAVIGECPATNLQMTEGASLAAHVQRPNGQPLMNFPVQIERIATDTDRMFAPWLMRHENTDQDGRCRLHHVMAGRYKLSVHFQNTSVEREIELREGELCRFDYMFPGLVTMIVEVVDEDAKPRPDIRVGLSLKGSGRILKTDAAGRVRFEGLGAQECEITLSEANTRFSNAVHSVMPTDVVRLIMPSTHDTGRIAGRFAVTGSKLPVGLQASLIKDSHANHLTPDRAQIDIDSTNGEFAIARLPVGHYHLWANGSEHSLGARTNIEVVANRTTQLGSIQLGTGRIHVEAAGKRTTDKIDIGVALESVGPFSHLLPSNLPAGAYRVLIWGDAYRPCFTDALVEIGRTTTVRVDLAPGVRTEVQLPAEAGVLDVHMPDGSTISLITVESTWVRGLAPGGYRLQHRTLNGARRAAEFEVGASPGPAIRLRKIQR